MLYYLLDLQRTVRSGHAFYWKQNKHGYVMNLKEAGTFTLTEALNITNDDLDNDTVIIPASSVDRYLS